MTTIIAPTVEILLQHKTAYLLNLLNNLRTSNNLPVIKAWKESKEKLAKEILKQQAKRASDVTSKVPPAIAKGAYDKKRNAPKTKVTKPARIKSISAERKAIKPDKGDSELLAFIKSKGFTPKTARNRFRTHKVAKVEGRYVLNADTKAALA